MISGFFWVCFLSLIKNPLQTLCQSTRLHFVSFLHHNWSLLRSSLRGYVKEITTTRKSWKSPRATHFVCFSTLAFRYPMFFSRFIYSHKRRIKRKWDYTWSRALTSLWNILWSTSSQKDKTWYYWRKKRKSLSKHLNGFRISCPVKRGQEHPTSLCKLSITMVPNVALRSNFFRLYCVFAIVADYYPPYSRLPRLKKIDKEHTV